MIETQNTLSSMIIPIPPNLKNVVYKEISDEYTKSLEGFNIDKSKYPHLKNIDSKELINVSESIKNTLDSKKNYYLHNGDFNLN